MTRLSAYTYRGILDCLEGEKDPRCLILCLKVVAKTQTFFPQAADEYAEAIFDVTACYFPITFTPPPNDPYGITPDMLSSALQTALTARYVSMQPCRVGIDMVHHPSRRLFLPSSLPQAIHGRVCLAFAGG